MIRGTAASSRGLGHDGATERRRSTQPGAQDAARLRHVRYVVAASQECEPRKSQLFIARVSAAGSGGGTTEGNPEGRRILGARCHLAAHSRQRSYYIKAHLFTQSYTKPVFYYLREAAAICNLYQVGGLEESF